MPLCTRSAASSEPAPPESIDMTMMSAGSISSLTTSALPAACRIGLRTLGKTPVAVAAKATATSGEAHLSRENFVLRLIHGPRNAAGKTRLLGDAADTAPHSIATGSGSRKDAHIHVPGLDPAECW